MRGGAWRHGGLHTTGVLLCLVLGCDQRDPPSANGGTTAESDAAVDRRDATTDERDAAPAATSTDASAAAPDEDADVPVDAGLDADAPVHAASDADTPADAGSDAAPWPNDGPTGRLIFVDSFDGTATEWTLERWIDDNVAPPDSPLAIAQVEDSALYLEAVQDGYFACGEAVASRQLPPAEGPGPFELELDFEELATCYGGIGFRVELGGYGASVYFRAGCPSQAPYTVRIGFGPDGSTTRVAWEGTPGEVSHDSLPIDDAGEPRNELRIALRACGADGDHYGTARLTEVRIREAQAP